MFSPFPLIIFFASFSIYLFTLFPSIYWRDASEFQAIGYLLDIAHPAGSPLYALIAKWMTFLPLGSIAFKITLLSALFGAGFSVVFFLMMRSMLNLLFNRSKPPISENSINGIALITTLFLSFSNAVWENANRAEVYTFQNFFTVILTLLLLKMPPFVSKTDIFGRYADKIICSLSFLFGLSLGAHAILILYLPCLLSWAYYHWLKPKHAWISKAMFKQFLVMLFFFLLGVSVYLYLPIRSAQNPYYDWGNPETLNNFIFHASDRKDANFHFNVPQGNIFLKLLSIYWDLYLGNFSFLGVFLGFLGFCYLLVKKCYAVLSLLALFFFPPFIFFIRYWTENSAYIPTFMVLCILLGIGIGSGIVFFQNQLGENQRKKSYLGLASVLLIMQFMLIFFNHFKQNSKQMDYWQTTKIMSGMLDRLDPGAVIIGYHSWFGLNYLQQVEGKRPDVTILSLSSFIVPDLFTAFEESRFKNIVIPKVPAAEFASAFLTENVYKRPIYWEPVVDYNKFVNHYLVPESMFFKINPTEHPLTSELVRTYLSQLSDDLALSEMSEDLEESAFYAQLLSGHGAYFLEKGMYEIALGHFKMAAALVPNQTHFLNLLGITYAYLEDYQKAEETFLQSILVNRENYEPYLNLAKMFMNNAQQEQAMYYFNKASEYAPNDRDALFALGKINAGLGNKQEALHFFHRILTINPKDEEAKKEADQLSVRIQIEGETRDQS